MSADPAAFWAVDAGTLGAILAMAAATYGVRAGGFWLISRVQPNRFVEAWLRQIPGAMPSLLNLPSGCAFRSRCSHATDICAQTPELREVDLRALRCFHPVSDATNLASEAV